MRHIRYVGVAAPVLLIALSACGGSGAEPTPSGTGPSTSQSATAPGATSQSAAAAGTPSATRAPDPEAPSDIAPVTRSGAPATRLTGAPAQGKGAVSFSDGLSVTLKAVDHGTVSDQGPGAIPGQAITTYTLEARNAGATPIDLTSVVVSARYGSPAKLARAVYQDGTIDFGSSLAPGAAATAVYAFAVPMDGDPAVDLVVDADALRTPAVFRGVH